MFRGLNHFLFPQARAVRLILGEACVGWVLWGGVSCLSCPGSRSCDSTGKYRLLKKQALSIYLNSTLTKSWKGHLEMLKFWVFNKVKLWPQNFNCEEKCKRKIHAEIDLSKLSPGMTKTESAGKDTMIALIRFHTVKRVNMLCSDGSCNWDPSRTNRKSSKVKTRKTYNRKVAINGRLQITELMNL